MNNTIFKFRVRNLIFSCAFAILTLILSIVSSFWSPLGVIDNKLNDSMFQHESQPAKEIYIVGIDDPTIEKYDAYNPIEYRKYFADILNSMSEKGVKPAVIGFDVIFNKTYGCDEVDLELANAMKKHNVVLGVNGMSRKEAPYGLSNTIYEGASDIGYVDAVTDSDEAIRRTYLKGDKYNTAACSPSRSVC